MKVSFLNQTLTSLNCPGCEDIPPQGRCLWSCPSAFAEHESSSQIYASKWVLMTLFYTLPTHWHQKSSSIQQGSTTGTWYLWTLTNKSTNQHQPQSQNSARHFQQCCPVLTWGRSIAKTFSFLLTNLHLMKETQKLSATPASPPDTSEPGFNVGSLEECDIEWQWSVSSQKAQLLWWWKLTAGIASECDTHKPDVWHQSPWGIHFTMPVLVSRPLCGVISSETNKRQTSECYLCFHKGTGSSHCPHGLKLGRMQKSSKLAVRHTLSSGHCIILIFFYLLLFHFGLSSI